MLLRSRRGAGSSARFLARVGLPSFSARQFVVTAESFGVASSPHLHEVIKRSGLTPLPTDDSRRDHWRLDVVLDWLRANNLERVPVMTKAPLKRRRTKVAERRTPRRSQRSPKPRR